MSRASAARNSRRASAKGASPQAQPNVKVVPVPMPGAGSAGPPRASQTRNPQFLNRLRRLVSGDEASPNRMVTYLLGQLKEAEAELGAIDRNLQQAEAQVAQMRTEFNRVDGRVQARVDDLANWIDEPGDDVPEAAEAPAPEPAAAAAP